MTPRRALSYCLAALAFFLPLSIAGANAALAATNLALLWLVARPAGRSEALSALSSAARSRVFLALTAYTSWSLICSFGGLNPRASLSLWHKDAHKLWSFLTIAVALATVEKAVISRPLAAGLGLHAAVGLYQAASQWLAGAERVRAHGFLHPVSYAEALCLGLIGLAGYLARPNAATIRRRLPAGLLLSLIGAALVASQTRAVLFALAAAYAASCALEARWRRHALAFLLVLAGVVAFWEVMPTGGRNLRNLISADRATTAHRARFVLWDVALRIVSDRPLTGVGPGRFRAAFESYHPEKLDGEGSWGNAHNLYLHQLAERGVPGLLFLLAVLTVFALDALRAERARGDAWSLWAATATAAFLVMNLTEVAWQTEQIATLFFFAWLLGAGTRPTREIL